VSGDLRTGRDCFPIKVTIGNSFAFECSASALGRHPVFEANIGSFITNEG
jgi:hypothetical protein